MIVRVESSHDCWGRPEEEEYYYEELVNFLKNKNQEKQYIQEVLQPKYPKARFYIK